MPVTKARWDNRSNLRINKLFIASGITPRKYKEILSLTNNFFGNLIDEAKNHGVSIYFNNNHPVTTNEILAEKIAPYVLQNQGKTLLIFKKAIRIVNEYAQQTYKHEDLNISYQYELNLGKLTPKYLERHDLQNKANDFLESVGLVGSFNLLRELGAAKRVYRCKITPRKGEL